MRHFPEKLGINSKIAITLAQYLHVPTDDERMGVKNIIAGLLSEASDSIHSLSNYAESSSIDTFGKNFKNSNLDYYDSVLAYIDFKRNPAHEDTPPNKHKDSFDVTSLFK